MDLSLPQTIDLTTHQRQRAEQALAVVRRHLAAQEIKVARMRDLLERLPEYFSSGSEAHIDDQLAKHQEAARKEYDQALQTMEKLQATRKKLHQRVESKREAEKQMEPLPARPSEPNFGNSPTTAQGEKQNFAKVLPMVRSQ